MRKRHFVLAAATIGITALGISRQAFATSYASGVSVSGTTLTFDLNESINGTAAPSGSSNGSVTLFYNGTSQTLGALSSGLQTVTLSATPTTPVQIAVTTNDPNGYLAYNSASLTNGVPGATTLEIDPEFLSGASNSIVGSTGVGIGSPRGVTVDTNPADATFGYVFGTNSAVHSGNWPQQGVYMLHGDLSSLGTPTGTYAGTTQATTPMPTYSAGFSLSGSNAPWHVTVGSDGQLYVDTYSDASTSIYSAPISTTTGIGTGSNVLTGVGVGSRGTGGVPILSANENHADVVGNIYVTGSTATNNLNVYAIDSSYGSAGATSTAQYNFDQFYDWKVGNDATGTPGVGAEVVPTPLTNSKALGLDTRFWKAQPSTTEYWFNDLDGVIYDLARGGPANQFYVTQSRSAGAQPDLFVLSPTDNSTVWWTSLDETQRQNLSNADFFLGAYSENVSPDGRFLAIGQSSSANVYFGGYVVPMLAGMPDVRLSQPININVGGLANTAANYVRGIAFDAADNIYAVNSGEANLAEFGSGSSSTVVTGSNGTFTNSAQWTGTSGSTLSSSNNWLVGNSPTSNNNNNSNNQAITFGAITSGHYSVSVDTGVNVGAMTFSSSTGYTLSNGGGSITMSGLGGNITATAGSHIISAPVNVNTDLGIYAAAGASVELDSINYGNVAEWSNVARPAIVISGPGTVKLGKLNLVTNDLLNANAQVVQLQTANYPAEIQTAQGTTNADSSVGNTLFVPKEAYYADESSGNLDIYQGHVQLLPNSGTAVISELTLLNGASLDLSNNDLIYDYSFSDYVKKSPLAVVTGLVAGGQLFSSSASLANGTALAVVENSNYGLVGNAFTNFEGNMVNVTPTDANGNPIAVAQSFTITNTPPTPPPATLMPATETINIYNSGAVLVKYTYYGDLNLDGKIDGTDYAMLGDGVKGWSGGDLNYDGVINADDYGLFQLGAASYSASQVVLPEPVSLALIGLAALPMIRRRRA